MKKIANYLLEAFVVIACLLIVEPAYFLATRKKKRP